MGPTASGKTALAVKIAQHLPCEIISVDSAMVYRGLDIGTAKPDKKILAEIPHHLLNIRNLDERYSAGDFRRDAIQAINAIRQRGKIPLLVGGSMLYFHVLQHGLAHLPGRNSAIRQSLQQEANTKGWPALHQLLQTIDAQAAAAIHPNDGSRIQRAIEVYAVSGHSLSTWQQQQLANQAYHFYNVVLAPSERAILHQSIAQRFYEMLEQGLLAEVMALYQHHTPDLAALLSKIINYREVWSYVAGSCSLETMQQRAIIATRQFAKHQLTWLRRYDKAQWFASEAQDTTATVLRYLTALVVEQAIN
jgi:tRNA dimethylallyltransferase